MPATSLSLAAATLTALLATGPSAQTQTSKVTSAPSPQPAEIVDVKKTFCITTPMEYWSLDDPYPTSTVTVGDKTLSLSERMIADSPIGAGERQVLFPIAWYEPYMALNLEYKYVLVKYKDGKAYSVMAEYMPERVSFPRAEYQLHPDGKTYYRDVVSARADGRIYFKQIFSTGTDDGKGGLWADMVLVYYVPDKTPPSPDPSKQPPGKKPAGKRSDS